MRSQEKKPHSFKCTFLCPAPWMRFSSWSPGTLFSASSVQQALAKHPLDAGTMLRTGGIKMNNMTPLVYASWKSET